MIILTNFLCNLSRLLMIAIFSLVGGFGAVIASDITEYANGAWLTAAWQGQEAELVGCQPAHPLEEGGINCGLLDYTLPAPAPAWTFEAGPGGAQLTVIDNWNCVDQFAVYDNGELIGLTSEPPEPSILCYDDPEFCIDVCSTGYFDMLEGGHSITLVSEPSISVAGSAYFRVDGDVGAEPEEVEVFIKSTKVRVEEDTQIPVVVLSNPEFDARLIDRATVRFGPADASPVGVSRWTDVNKDGLRDLYMRFEVTETGIQCEDTEATFKGTWVGLDGTTVQVQGIANFTTRCK